MSSSLGTLLSAAAEEIQRLEERVRVLSGAKSDPEAMRLIYRRGYSAGHTAGRAGRSRASAPERHCRGDLRRLLVLASEILEQDMKSAPTTDRDVEDSVGTA